MATFTDFKLHAASTPYVGPISPKIDYIFGPQKFQACRINFSAAIFISSSNLMVVSKYWLGAKWDLLSLISKAKKRINFDLLWALF